MESQWGKKKIYIPPCVILLTIKKMLSTLGFSKLFSKGPDNKYFGFYGKKIEIQIPYQENTCNMNDR